VTLVNLHFAGSRLYNPEKFETEAARVGVARRLPAFALKNLTFGETVLLASFEGRRGDDGHALHGEDGKAIRLGTADAWGSFFVNGVNVDAPPELRAKLYESLHVVRVDEFSEPPRIERECGSYEIVAVAIVRDSLRDIVEAGEAIAKDLGVKVKWSVTGNVFRPLAPHVKIEDVPFTRTLVRVFLEGWSPFVTPPEAEAEGRPIFFIGDYSLRRYRPMTDEERAVSNRRRIEAMNRARLIRAKRKLGEPINRDDDIGEAST